MSRWLRALATGTFLVAAGAQAFAGPPDEDLTGHWRIELSGEPPSAVSIQDNAGSVTATYIYVGAEGKKKYGLEDGMTMFSGRRAGNQLTIDFRFRSEKTPEGTFLEKVVPATLTIRVVDEERRLSGEFPHFRYVNKEWKEDGSTRLEGKPACPSLKGPFTFGSGALSVQINLKEPLAPLPQKEDSEARKGFCHYSIGEAGDVQIQIGALGDISIPPVSVPSVGASFYLRELSDPKDSKNFRDLTLSWSDDETRSVVLFQRWGVSFVLYSLEVTFEVSPETGALRFASGAVEIQADAGKEIHVGGPVYLSGNLSGLIRFDWTPGEQNWTSGTWSFDGLVGCTIEMRREGSIPVASLTLDATRAGDGEVSGRLELAAPDQLTWDVAGLEIQILESSLTGKLSLIDGTMAVVEGGLVGKVSFGGRSKTELIVDLNWDGKLFSAKVRNNGEFKIFGGVCSNIEVLGVINQDELELVRLQGRLSWRHGDFAEGTSIEINDCLIEEGTLKRFEGSGTVSLKGFSLNVRKLVYEGTAEPAVLRLSAKVVLGLSDGASGAIEIENFTINSEGRISDFAIKAELNVTPVSLSLRATYDQKKLSGEFSGSIARAIRLEGSVIVGHDDRDGGFNYGYLALNVRIAKGLPIGQSGLMVLGLGGALGFNYAPEGSALGEGPRKGTYYMAGSITIGDVGGLAELQGKIAVTLGRDNSVQIIGTIQVTQSEPYFLGQVECNYVFGGGEIRSSLTATVMIPKNGSLVRIDRNRLDAAVGNNRWSLRGEGLGGEFGGALTVSRGSIGLGGDLSAPLDSLTGHLSAHLEGGTNQSVSFQALGFTVKGGLRFRLSGDPRIKLRRSGVDGSVEVDAQASGRVEIRTPSLPLLGSKTFIEEVGASAKVSVETLPNGLRFTGDFRIYDSSGNEFSTQLSYEF